ncbi:hypothetical protein [Neomegalonema sp.]|uniref:hypothetical protein n=1 Tax=Neomegalonema sp. TaxID=2039713 RepID=UPI00263046D5|nr:hypothetical protein [Neomegalonema sp.]MDD2869813.1 hypothetical protein [Neomegalonema sp.]
MTNPDVSVEKWMEILQDPGTTTPEALRLFRKLYALPDRRSTVWELGAEMGFPFFGDKRSLSTPTINLVIAFGKRVDRHFGLRVYGRDLDQSFWLLPFDSLRKPDGEWLVGKRGFIWILRPELAEAMERLGLAEEPREESHD